VRVGLENQVLLLTFIHTPIRCITPFTIKSKHKENYPFEKGPNRKIKLAPMGVGHLSSQP